MNNNNNNNNNNTDRILVILPSPIDLRYRPYTLVTLPCDRM